MTKTFAGDTAFGPDILSEAEIGSASIDRFEPIIGPEAAQRLRVAAERIRSELDGRTVWNVNSTDKGGGVAEMLHALLPYARGAEIDTRWLVIDADDEFFTVTKRLHNRLHDQAGDGGALDDSARAAYERTLTANRDALLTRVEPQDVVLFHDPQTAGLIPAVKETGAAVVWRCHIGADDPGASAREGWDFLRPYLDPADRLVFTCRGHVWSGI